LQEGAAMSSETAFLIAAGVTALVAVVVVAYLRGPLLGSLHEMCGTEQRARFWTAYSNAVLLLVPLVALMLARLAPPAADSLVFAVVGYLQWSMVGLVVTLFVVAVGAALIQPAEPVVTRGQIDDLQRLVAKIEELRAHEIVRRASAERGVRAAGAPRVEAQPAVSPGGAPSPETPAGPA
jgi:hypothetical protein